MVRRLPVLQSSADEPDARPRWHWVLIGAGFVLTIWLPLLIVALWLSPVLISHAFDINGPEEADRIVSNATGKQQALWLALTAGPVLMAFVLASLSAGALVTRFGKPAGLREAALGGALAAAGAGSMAAAGSGLANWPVLVAGVGALLTLGAAMSALGGLIGSRRKQR